MTIEIVKNSDDLLSCEIWRFWFLDRESTFKLNYYGSFSKKTRRHKFIAEVYYDKLDHRSSNLAVEDVPFPPELKEKVIEKLISRIEVSK